VKDPLRVDGIVPSVGADMHSAAQQKRRRHRHKCSERGTGASGKVQCSAA